MLVYLIPWWGGCSSYLMDCLQVLQTRAARIVTRSGWRVSTEKLLHQCGWLSVRQLVHYHSLVLVFQIRHQEKPAYFRKHFSANFSYKTRLATTEGIRRIETCKYNVTQSSFIQRSSAGWNQLPVLVRDSRTIIQFKNRLRNWIKSNVTV